MAERKAVNKYYPPDWRPEMGSLNRYHKTHALRSRAKKLGQGILKIRFEMPYNIWCNGCKNHIGMGVRYNAEKLRMGDYFSTPIFKFTMRCHLCPQKIEIQTDPQNNDYKILSGAKRKEERWDAEASGAVVLMEYDDKVRLQTDPMFKLEHGNTDKQKAKSNKDIIDILQLRREITSQDDYSSNRLARDRLRQQKKIDRLKNLRDDSYKRQHNLAPEIKLLDNPLNEEDEKLIESTIFTSVDNEKEQTDPVTAKKLVKRSGIFQGLSNTKPPASTKGLSKSAQSLLYNISMKKAGKR